MRCRVLVCFPKESEYFGEDRFRGMLEDRRVHGDRLGAQAQFLFELPPPRAFHGREIVFLGRAGQSRQGPRITGHGEKSGLGREPVQVRRVGLGEVLPYQHRPAQSPSLGVKSPLQTQEGRPTVHAREQAYAAFVRAGRADKERALEKQRREKTSHSLCQP